jgi:hypothetical protein
VLFERDYTVGATGLFEPRKTETVRVDTRDDIAAAVVVDVVDVHLRAAAADGAGPGAESKLVLLPNGVARERSGLFPPAVFFEDVVATVAVDVTETEPVREPLPCAGRCDGMERPRAHRIFRLVRRVANLTATRAQQRGWFVVAEDFSEGWGFVVDGQEHDVSSPRSAFGAGIGEP